jgi:hypothetical protein
LVAAIPVICIAGRRTLAQNSSISVMEIDKPMERVKKIATDGVALLCALKMVIPFLSH